MRRKALEVLNAKLQHQRGGASGGGGRGGEDVFAEMLTEVDDSERLVSLLEPLTNSGLGKVVKDKQEASQETELNQQLALVALRSEKMILFFQRILLFIHSFIQLFI